MLNPTKSRSETPWWIGLVVLVLAPCVICAPSLWRGEIPLSMDTAMYFFPLRWHAASLLHSGQWPFWNRCILGGMPLFSNPQAAIGYPLNWMMFAWPGGFSFAVPYALQLGIYAAATAILARRLGVPPFVALWAGATLLAGNYGWSRLQFGNYMNVLPWWPIWLLAAHAYVTCGGGKWIALGALAGTMLVLSGAHQLALYAAFGLTAYVVASAAMVPGERNRWLFYPVSTAILALLLGAAGWLPQLSFLRETARADALDSSKILAGAFGTPLEILAALAGSFGPGIADAESSASIGILAIFCAVLVPPAGGRRRAWVAAWAMAAVTMLASWRPVAGLLLHAAPLAAFLHDPRRMLGVTQWALVLAASLGIGGWIERSERMHLPRMMKWIPRLALVASVLVLAFGTARTTDFSWISAKALFDAPDGAAPLLIGAKLAPGQRFFSLDWQAATSYDYRRSDRAEWLLPNLAMLWGLEDLGGYEPARSVAYDRWLRSISGWPGARQPWEAYFDLYYPRTGLPPPETVAAALVPRWGLPAYLREVQSGVFAGLAPALPISSEIRAVYLPEKKDGEERSFAVTFDSGRVVRRELKPEEAEPPASGEELMARLVVHRIDLGADNVGDVRIIGVQLGVKPGDIPVGVFFESPETGQSYQAISTNGLTKLLAVKSPGAWLEIQGEPSPPIRILSSRIRANELALDLDVPGGAEASSPALLILRDAVWPGWSATVNDLPVAVSSVSTDPWRRIPVPRGLVRVRMNYSPPGMRLALVLTLFGLVGLLGTLRWNKGGAETTSERADSSPAPPEAPSPHSPA